MSAGYLAPADNGVLYGLGYGRISGSKEQKDSALSIPSQERHYRAAMEREGVLYLDSTSDILKGTRSDRVGYQRLLAMVRRLRAEGKPLAVFVFRLDRFGRDTEERSRAWKELAKLGVRLYAVQNGGWVTERFLYDLDAALAQREVTLIGQRVSSVNDFVRANGFPKIGRLAWGYRVRAATTDERAAGAGHKMLELHPDERDAVRRAWRMRAEGASLGDVHRWVMGLSDRERGGRRLARATFARLFTAPVYVARLEYPDGHPLAATPVLDRPMAKWPALIDDVTYRKVALIPDDHRHRPKQASGQFLLTGVLRCHRCGARMTGRHQTARDRTPRQQYQCIGNLGGADATAEQRTCSTVIVAEPIDAWTIQQVQKTLAVFDDPDAKADLTRLWDELRTAEPGGGDVGGRLARAEQRRAKWASARSQAFADYAAGEITKAERDEVRVRAAGEIEDAERELAAARRSLADADDVQMTVLPPLAVLLGRLDGWEAALGAGDTASQRGLVGEVIERVTPVAVKRGVYKARIEWTPRGRALRHVSAAWRRAAAASVDGRVHVETLAWTNTTTLTRTEGAPAARRASQTPAPAPALARSARGRRPADPASAALPARRQP